jgi:hypothetical protein
MKNKIEDLRNHLFATLEDLRDKDNPMAIDRALAVAKVADSIIDSAKVEVKFLEVTGAEQSKFLGEIKEKNVTPAGQSTSDIRRIK